MLLDTYIEYLAILTSVNFEKCFYKNILIEYQL